MFCNESKCTLNSQGYFVYNQSSLCCFCFVLLSLLPFKKQIFKVSWLHSSHSRLHSWCWWSLAAEYLCCGICPWKSSASHMLGWNRQSWCCVYLGDQTPEPPAGKTEVTCTSAITKKHKLPSPYHLSPQCKLQQSNSKRFVSDQIVVQY